MKRIKKIKFDRLKIQSKLLDKFYFFVIFLAISFFANSLLLIITSFSLLVFYISFIISLFNDRLSNFFFTTFVRKKELFLIAFSLNGVIFYKIDFKYQKEDGIIYINEKDILKYMDNLCVEDQTNFFVKNPILISWLLHKDIEYNELPIKQRLNFNKKVIVLDEQEYKLNNRKNNLNDLISTDE